MKKLLLILVTVIGITNTVSAHAEKSNNKEISKNPPIYQPLVHDGSGG